jgi:hypothetical protein
MFKTEHILALAQDFNTCSCTAFITFLESVDPWYLAACTGDTVTGVTGKSYSYSVVHTKTLILLKNYYKPKF